jgi:hypothetical protein
LNEIIQLAWYRFKIITAIIGDVQGRLIATLFYVTVLVPFGLASRMLSDPLRIRRNSPTTSWLDRLPVSEELESARRQG